tara:strand:- start:1024 stop:1689 length:666 start_codon:yes stop_codon:yes gene_type:complete
MRGIDIYKNLIFDCDGIILNSNKIKTDAFREVVSIYGKEASISLVKYHLQNGGISRYHKFNYFLNTIAKNLELDIQNISLDELTNNYSKCVRKKLLNCEIDESIISYRKSSNSIWSIVSGSDQHELNQVFRERNIDSIFDGGIHGSPLSKIQIFKRIFEENKNDIQKSLYIGDSKYDYLAAKEIGLDFIFLTKWSEFREIKAFSKENNIRVFFEFSDLLEK